MAGQGLLLPPPLPAKRRWYDMPAALMVEAIKVDDPPYQAIEPDAIESIVLEQANPDVLQAIEVLIVQYPCSSH